MPGLRTYQPAWNALSARVPGRIGHPVHMGEVPGEDEKEVAEPVEVADGSGGYLF